MKKYQHILMATESLHCEGEVIDQVREMAVSTGAKISLVHAFKKLCSNGEAYALHSVVDMEERLLSEAKTGLAQVGKCLGLNERDLKLVVGSPGDVISQEAKKLKADLVILAAQKDSSKKRREAITKAVLKKSNCDILNLVAS